MERIDTLNRSQVLKELQSHKRYTNKTQKEIGDKLGGVKDLRKELYRLENKTVAKNTFLIKGEYYTENE